MELILKPILVSFVIVALITISFFLLSFKYKPLEKYRGKVVEASLWIWGILSAILILDNVFKRFSDKEETPLEIQKRLNDDLEENRDEFQDKMENPDPPDDLAKRGRDLAERLRRR